MSTELVPGDAVRAIQAGVQPELIVVREREYSSRPVFLPPAEPVPARPVILHTLAALAAFAIDQQEKLGTAEKLIIHVDSPTDVELMGDVRSDGQRPVFAVARCERKPFDFGRYQEQSDFVLGVQISFVNNDEKHRLLSLVGTIKSSRVIEASDDGVTQTVMARKGITREAEVDVRNPFELQPYRTFAEVEQPVSPFVLRLKGESDELPMAGLWSCDGDAWKLDAVKNIADYLDDAGVGEIPVFV